MKLPRLGIFGQFVALGTVVFVAIGLFLVNLVAPTLTEFVLEQQKLNAVVFANRLAAEFLVPEDFAQPALAGESRERFERFARRLQVPGLFRIKIWNRENVMVYSDNEELIGRRFPPHEEVEEAFELHTVVELERFDPDDPHFAYDEPFVGDTIETYAPITFGDSPEAVGVIETYARAGFLLKEIEKVQNLFVQRIIASLLAMFAALSFIVWRASRTVATQQARLQEYATGLEKMVEERTRKLRETTERQVRQAEELARLKDEFVALASHQLRTPPSIINWYSEMLLSGEVGALNEKQREYIDEIYRATKRMVALINDFLNISRIESGALAISPEPTDLREIAKSVIQELGALISAKGTRIETHYAEDLPTIDADQKFARIIFQNLISNAIKYTPPGGKVEVTIGKEGANIAIEVRDNGYGIPQDQQAKIFTKLFRADNARKKEAEGTGLGLYLVKSVVEQGGGTISFESKEDRGTTFRVTIPLSGMKKKEGAVSLA